MSHPVIVEFNRLIYEAQYEDGTHVLRRFLSPEATAFPFADGSTSSTIYDDSREATCGLAIDKATGVIVADIPISDDPGLLTRISRECGEPGTWETVGE